MNVVELHLAVRLFRVSRNEFYIFVAACVSVLVFGTIYGVVIGLLLSFVAVVLRATNPPRSFRGMIPGKEAYYDLKRNRNAYPIRHTVIYRFSENLFFANIKVFQTDIENNIKEDTKVVIVDAAAINSIDITAADRLEMMAENFERKGIKFYITEHSENVNEQMRKLGIGHLIEEGKVRRTILAALQDAGIPSMGTTAGADKARDPLVWMLGSWRYRRLFMRYMRRWFRQKRKIRWKNLPGHLEMMRLKKWRRKYTRSWNRFTNFRIWKDLQT